MRTSSITPRLLGVAALLGLIGCQTPADAARWVDVTIHHRDTGERLPTYRHDGKLYVAGRPGERYGIEVRNKDGGRVLTVISVDGVNVLTGQTAATQQSGYVLDGGQKYAITGWRKSMDEVAQFLFTALPDSYAARTGRPNHVGVIGVAVFREKVEPLPPPVVSPVEPYPESRYETNHRDIDATQQRRERADETRLAAAAPAPATPGSASGGASAKASTKASDNASDLASLDAASPAESDRATTRQSSDRRLAKSLAEEKSPPRLGTGHGEREHAPTRSTEFARISDRPDEIVTIHYDSRTNLIARGIIRAPRITEPQPFPGGFVPDPRG